jgi:SAM-dependent methyltransferase
VDGPRSGGAGALVAVTASEAEAFADFEASAWSMKGKAQLYHDFVGRVTVRVAGGLLEAAAVEPGMRLLDVATGPGYVAAAAATRGAYPVGVDVSREMLAFARNLNPGLDFRFASAERLPFPDAGFDAVVASFLLHHLARPERALREFARVLRVGGKVAVTAWDVPERAPLIGLLGEAASLAGAEPPPFLAAGRARELLATDEELRRLLLGAGFEHLHLTTIAFRHHVPSVDALWSGSLGGSVRTAEIVRRQPAARRRLIRGAFEGLAERYRAVDGFEVPVSVRLAVAVKP